ncbi:hypothetical protein KC19_VG236200 [Ceratodon purpureus]|uniref:Uncharacterized protein n=1 Tax=Ceratodon purpureus TaxID=3225 RepID=A0A8T0HTK2_CERPU|nr:hypothetical protein KC19_VG236200 [Ceratodon purpureus]
MLHGHGLWVRLCLSATALSLDSSFQSLALILVSHPIGSLPSITLEHDMDVGLTSSTSIQFL